MSRVDVVVVGDGPAGLAAAQVLGRSRRDVAVLAGGQNRNGRAPATHALPGSDGISPTDLHALALRDLTTYPTVRVDEALAVSVEGAKDAFLVHGSDGEVRECRRLLLATGVVDVLPDIPGLAERWGTGVLHCPYCHGWENRERPLAVLALGPADPWFAVTLTQWSDSIVLCPGSVELGDTERSVLQMAGVTVRPGAVRGIDGPQARVDRISFDDGDLEVDAVYCHVPTRQGSDLAAALGCELLDDGSVAVDEFGGTTVPGVHAVGDMARRREAIPEMHYVATAASSGVLAAVGMNQELVFSSLGAG